MRISDWVQTVLFRSRHCRFHLMPATIRASGIMQKPSRPLRLGTRGSPLALAQAHMTVAALRARHGWDEGAVEIVVVQTRGDRIQDRALADIGGKALCTKELDRALARGESDFARPSRTGRGAIRTAQTTHPPIRA